LQRRAKECGFDLVPISGLAMNEELKPFENSTILNGPCKLLVNVQKAQDLMHQIKWLKDDMAELHRDASIGAV